MRYTSSDFSFIRFPKGETALLLEFAKILLPAALSSLLITFYFQKRLARIGDFKEFTTELLKRFREGTERIYSTAHQLDQCIILLRASLEKDPLDRSELIKLMGDMAGLTQRFFGTLYEHRIYILSLVPFGDSGPLHSGLTGIVGYSELLISALESGEENEGKQQELRVKLCDSIGKWTSAYNSLREAIQESQKRILEGRLP